jgi:hypothetical protein
MTDLGGPDLKVTDVRVFVPARDFALSKDFYLALGWRQTWGNDSLAVMKIADQRFYLQNYYAREWAENFMLHISVNDANAWKQHVSTLAEDEKFKDVRIEGPKQEPYGALVTYVWGPSGVLLHLAEWTNDD